MVIGIAVLSLLLASGHFPVARIASRLAGTPAGLMAGSFGAAAYSLTCDETSIAVLGGWCSLGMLAWAAAGALLGPRRLRW